MHCIHHSVFKENVNKNTVLSQANAYANREGDYKDQIHTIRWIDNVICDDENAAREYIEKHDKGWYDNLAVRFYDYSSVELKKTKKVEALEERVSNLRSRLYTLEHTPYAETLTSTEFVGCKGCGSKIATKYLKGNYCPVCGADMRPKTTLDRIASTKERLAETEKELHNEMSILQKKKKDKAKIMWCVKIEFHC